MEITTPRLLLRDFTEEDLPALLRYQTDPRYSEFHGPEESGPDLAHNLIRMFLAWAAERPRQNYQLAIAQRDRPEEAIGNCGVRLKGCESGRAELGLELAPEHWGHGFASEAARAILDFGFRDLGVQEIHGVTITENVRVQRLVERLGFTKVETRPGAAWMSDRGWSETVWGITAAKW